MLLIRSPMVCLAWVLGLTLAWGVLWIASAALSLAGLHGYGVAVPHWVDRAIGIVIATSIWPASIFAARLAFAGRLPGTRWTQAERQPGFQVISHTTDGE